ncbi:hypothetical protein WJX84_001373 [Apatococcus fuscideae]|uniref:Uncharacterized protein n=1 Tax=Apatococcus fuscideae TaxID=2026836 RepID=A0AAW1T017_9CHLO
MSDDAEKSHGSHQPLLGEEIIDIRGEDRLEQPSREASRLLGRQRSEQSIPSSWRDLNRSQSTFSRRKQFRKSQSGTNGASSKGASTPAQADGTPADAELDAQEDLVQDAVQMAAQEAMADVVAEAVQEAVAQAIEETVRFDVRANFYTLIAITGVILYWRGIWTLWDYCFGMRLERTFGGQKAAPPVPEPVSGPHSAAAAELSQALDKAQGAPAETLSDTEPARRHVRSKRKLDQVAAAPEANTPQARRRVTFAKGPFAERYGTRDGHARREGTTAPQRRQLGSPWPIDLTPANVRLLEVELQGSCAWSLERLKRRAGLLPPIKRARIYATQLAASHGSAISPTAGRCFAGAVFKAHRAIPSHANGRGCPAIAASSGPRTTESAPLSSRLLVKPRAPGRPLGKSMLRCGSLYDKSFRPTTRMLRTLGPGPTL